MSKKKIAGIVDADYLRKLEENVGKLTDNVERDLAKVTEEFNRSASQIDQISDIIGRGIGSSSTNDQVEVESLLAQLLAEDVLEKKTAELGVNAARKSSIGASTPIVKKTPRSKSLDEGLRQQGSIPTDQQLQDRLDALKGPIPTDQQLQDRLDALKADSPIRRTKSVGDLSVTQTPSIVSFDEIKPVIATSLAIQAKLAIKEAGQVTDSHERDSLTNFASQLNNMRETVETMPSVPKEQESKISNIVATGLDKIYEGVKSLASSLVKNLAKMGETLVGLIKESPEKRMIKAKKNLKNSYETLSDLAGLNTEQRGDFTRKHFTEIAKITTSEQILKETIKVNKAIINVGAKKLQKNRAWSFSQADFIKQHSIGGEGGISAPTTTPNNHTKSSFRSSGR